MIIAKKYLYRANCLLQTFLGNGRPQNSQLRCAALVDGLFSPYSSSYCANAPKREIIKFEDSSPLAKEAQDLLSNLEVSKKPEIDIQRSYSLLAEAVSQNSPRAKTLLGSMYREGLMVEKNHDEAIRLFAEAAEQGDPAGKCSLGVLGLDIIEKKRKGLEDEVSSTDFVVDMNESGEMRGRLELETEDGPIKDAPKPAELVRRVRKARRKAGFTDQQSKEFEDFKRKEMEEGLEKERRVAFSWVEEAAEQGNDEAMVVLGNLYLETDPERAVEWYANAVRTGRNTDAYYNLGQIYTIGLEGVSADPKTALKNFAMAAQLGDASAQFYLGHLHRVGDKHVALDHASARQYIEMAAAQKHPGALYYLSLLHRNGEGGLEESQGTFLRYIQEAAKYDHGPAHACLADMYYTGSDGVSVDYSKALQSFLEAGRLGEAEAFCSAAAMHFHGLGVKEDKHEAFLLYQEAVQAGSIHALRNIASMHYGGDGVPQNRKLAEYFLKIADERDKEMQMEAEKQLPKTFETTDAPKHPMADVPRPKKRDWESQAEDDISST